MELLQQYTYDGTDLWTVIWLTVDYFWWCIEWTATVRLQEVIMTEVIWQTKICNLKKLTQIYH